MKINEGKKILGAMIVVVAERYVNQKIQDLSYLTLFTVVSAKATIADQSSRLFDAMKPLLKR
jgi:hypothetical protein